MWTFSLTWMDEFGWVEVLWRLLECQLSVGPLLLLQVSARQNDGWGPFWKYSFSVKQGLAEVGAP